MKNIIYTFLGMLLTVSVSAQLTNNGATIVVESGATLYIESDLNSTMGGTITIGGTGIVEVQGNIDNAGTVTMDDNAKLILSGSSASTVQSGGATFTNVEMAKTAQNVTLTDAMIISQDLNFVTDNNKLILGANNLTFTSTAGITSADANEYIVADAAGVVTKDMTAASMFKYEIGTADDKYTPLDADVTAGTFPLALSVNTVSMKQNDVPAEADDFINRFWNVDAVDDTNLEATLTGTYDVADLEAGATAGNVKGAHFGSDWTYTGAAAGANTAIGDIAENGDFTGTNSFGRASLMVMLDGAFSGGTMSNTLNTLDLLPTTSPYGGGEVVGAGFFAANTDIVDWVAFETRNATTPATVEGSGVGFVKTDGSVVALDGVSDPFLKDAATAGYVVIKHRNHLSVCTGSSITLDGTAALQDFTSSGYTAYGTFGLRDNGGTMTMWSGDTNGDGQVVFSGSGTDVNPISIDVFVTNTANTTFNPLLPYPGYNNSDANLTGETVFSGSGTDVNQVSIPVFLNPANTTFNPLLPLIAQIPN